MVKSLADELTDILNWIENPGLGDHAREEANAGLVIFCRGLVCGLRGGQQVTGDTPISVDEALLNAFKPDWDKAEAKRRAEEKAVARRHLEERRRECENAQRNEPKWDPEAPADLMAKVDVGFRGGHSISEDDRRIRPAGDMPLRSPIEGLKDLGCTPDCH